jgi:hypothetical protein
VSKKDFSISGPRRPAGMENHVSPATDGAEDRLDEFVAGQEPTTTMTFQLPTRLHTELKSYAVASRQKVKDVLIRFIQEGLGRRK